MGSESREVALDGVKLALISKCDTDSVIEAVQEAEDLIAERKRQTRIMWNCYPCVSAAKKNDNILTLV